jgi:ArsR family transcriptional regulator, arsenate/arsenite/antimonite-responsive transcriptional repressor
MAQIRSQAFPAELVGLAAAARALAHPGRLQLLVTLAERRSCVCGDLVEVMPLAQSTVSQHLKELKAAGLIRGEIDGPRTCYCLDPETLEAVRQGFARLFAGLGCPGPHKEG